MPSCSAKFNSRRDNSQQKGGPHKIGSISVSPKDRAWHVLKAVEDGLRDLGYVEGQNVVFEHRFADGRFERLPGLAAELIGLKVEVILVAPNPSVLAVKQATNTIPIVMTFGREPVESGFVKSLARPEGNITGLTADVTPDTWGKRLQLLKEITPKISRVAVLWNPTFPGLSTSWLATSEAATRLGIRLFSHETRRLEDFEVAFRAIDKEAVDAVLLVLRRA